MRLRDYRRAAIAAAVLTVFIMVLWIAFSHRRAADPLATPDLVKSNSIQEQKPFGAAGIAAPVQIKQNAATEKVVAPKEATTSKPSPAKSTKRLRRVNPAGSDEPDVVVRHFGTNTANAKKKTASKDGIKVFSDLE